jgi:hypothetical protein
MNTFRYLRRFSLVFLLVMFAMVAPAYAADAPTADELILELIEECAECPMQERLDLIEAYGQARARTNYNRQAFTPSQIAALKQLQRKQERKDNLMNTVDWRLNRAVDQALFRLLQDY